MIVKRLSANLCEGRERMIKRNRYHLYRFRAVAAFRRHIRNRYGKYGPEVGGDHDLKIHYGWLQPAVAMGVEVARETVKERAHKTFHAFLFATSKIFFTALKFKHTC